MDISLLALSFAYKVRVDHKHSKTAPSSYSRQCLHFFLSEQHPTGYLLDHHRKPKDCTLMKMNWPTLVKTKAQRKVILIQRKVALIQTKVMLM